MHFFDQRLVRSGGGSCRRPINVDKLNAYSGQLDSYRKTTGAVRALLVLMTGGRVIELV